MYCYILPSHIYNRDNFELPIARREIAEYIGMTTENVIRTLSEFKKDKIIRTVGKSIYIIDKKRLKEYIRVWMIPNLLVGLNW